MRKGKFKQQKFTLNMLLLAVIIGLAVVIANQSSILNECTALNSTLKAEVAKNQKTVSDFKQQVLEIQDVIEGKDVRIRELASLIDLQNTRLEEAEVMMTNVSRGSDGRYPIDLVAENKKLRETITKAFTTKGANYVKDFKPTEVLDLENYEFVSYEGEWHTTYYTPSKEECGNTKGITRSGKPIVPAYSVAIDPRYHSFGELYYVEGIGVVETHDTGSAILGEKRMDIGMLNSDISDLLGSDTRKVWRLRAK